MSCSEAEAARAEISLKSRCCEILHRPCHGVTGGCNHSSFFLLQESVVTDREPMNTLS